MPLSLDTSRARRTLTEIRELIEAVYGAHPEDETDALEWKREVDLGMKRWIVETARTAIGMANRDPDDAALAFEGCGYILLGVEPGRYSGVDRLDPADADNRLAPYLGRKGPRCRWDTIDLGGVDVAVITVEAPHSGDPLFCLEKAFQEGGKNYAEGTVYVRRQGKTEQANGDDLRRLTERATARQERIELQVDITGSAPLLVVDDSASCVQRWTRRRMDVAMQRALALTHPRAAPPDDADSQTLPNSNLLDPGTLAAITEAFSGLTKPETRSLEEFEKEYATWAQTVAEQAGEVIRHELARTDASPKVGTRITNTTERPFAAVQVELRILTSGVSVHLPGGPTYPPRLRREPRAFGPKPSSLMGPIVYPSTFAATVPAMAALARSMWQDEDDPSVIYYHDVDLRANTSVKLQPFVLIGGPALVGRDVRIAWSATASNVDGRLFGEASIPIGDVVIDAGRMLDEVAASSTSD